MSKLHLLIPFFLLGCIGTDVLDDPIVPEVLKLDREELNLLIGEETNIGFTYKNQYGLDEEIEVQWISENTSVAAIEKGQITAINTGQSNVYAVYNGIRSSNLLVNVVSDTNEIVSVRIISAVVNNLNIDDTIRLEAEAINILGHSIDTATISWFSEDQNIVNFVSGGLLMAKSEGMVSVFAESGGKRSLGLTINVGSSTKMATFSGSSGYIAEGTASLLVDDQGQVILEFSNDFRTSFALGTFIYLANSTSGSAVKGSGLELGEITSNGAKSFNVSQISSSVTLDTYRYVIILCKPASITFGIGDFGG